MRKLSDSADKKADSSIDGQKTLELTPKKAEPATKVFDITDKTLETISNDERVHNFLMERFGRITVPDCEKLVRMLIRGKVKIHAKDVKDKYKGFLQYNMGKFGADGILKKEEHIKLHKELFEYLSEILKDLQTIDEDETLEKLGDACYRINRHTTYEMVRKILCDEMGRPSFKYDFNNPDSQIEEVKNKMPLQRTNIQILSVGVKFDYPVIFKYSCSNCRKSMQKKAYEVIGTRNKAICEGMIETIDAKGEPKIKPCTERIHPDIEVGSTKDAFYFNMSYETQNKKEKPSAFAFSFNDLEPGFYECVLFRIKNPKGNELYLIMDVKEIINNKYVPPEKKEGENYIFSLQKSFDDYIFTQTKMKIYGMYPVKIALLIQKLFNILNRKLIGNVQVIGDASTGKSTVLKYYGFLLNSNLNLSTNGISISVPGLRGTRNTLNLMNKDISIISKGHLGTYASIHIDEASENPVLIQNLKTFLLEDNYSYNRAGSNDISNIRTAQVNISQNLNNEHIGMYRGMIRKSYKESSIKIGELEKPSWDESWDLFLPIYEYTENLYLRKVIKDKRLELQQKTVWWIDGFDYALHQRFPFYFYLAKEKKNVKLQDTILENIQKDNLISENLSLIKALKSEDIVNMFDGMNKLRKKNEDLDDLRSVDRTIEKYGVRLDGRTRIFLHNIAIVSRMANGRDRMNQEDYDLVAWVIENTNRKIDVSDTDSYVVKGAPDLEKDKAADIKIEDETEEIEEFGLGEGEFHEV